MTTPNSCRERLGNRENEGSRKAYTGRSNQIEIVRRCEKKAMLYLIHLTDTRLLHPDCCRSRSPIGEHDQYELT